MISVRYSPRDRSMDIRWIDEYQYIRGMIARIHNIEGKKHDILLGVSSDRVTALDKSSH